jgi:hemerythrin-like domain-containing protein
MTQSHVRAIAPFFGSAADRARRAVERASAGCEAHLDLETDARPVLALLIQEGALDQAVLLLERDGPRARIAIRPRRASGPPSVTEIFEEDHARLDAIARVLCEEVKARRPAGALAAMLLDGLRRHIRIEEEVLFPVFESRCKRSLRGSTMLMRREHLAIERYLVELGRAVDRGRFPSPGPGADDVLRAHRGLSAVLGDHNVKEERGLFPTIDRATPAGGHSALLRRIVLF